MWQQTMCPAPASWRSIDGRESQAINIAKLDVLLSFPRRLQSLSCMQHGLPSPARGRRSLPQTRTRRPAASMQPLAAAACAAPLLPAPCAPALRGLAVAQPRPGRAACSQQRARRSALRPLPPPAAAAAGAAGAAGAGGGLPSLPQEPSSSSPLAAAADAAVRYVSRFRGLWHRFLPMVTLFFMLSFMNTLLVRAGARALAHTTGPRLHVRG